MDLELFKKQRIEKKEQDTAKEMNLELFKKKGAEEKRDKQRKKRDVDLGFKNTEATGRQKRQSTEKNVVTKFNLKRAAAMKTWRLKKADTI